MTQDSEGRFGGGDCCLGIGEQLQSVWTDLLPVSPLHALFADSNPSIRAAVASWLANIGPQAFLSLPVRAFLRAFEWPWTYSSSGGGLILSGGWGLR
jgi:hypothetical protein